MKQIESKTKAALTRTYNKLNLKRSYKIDSNEKAKKKKSSAADNNSDNDFSDDNGNRYARNFTPFFFWN